MTVIKLDKRGSESVVFNTNREDEEKLKELEHMLEFIRCWHAKHEGSLKVTLVITIIT